MRNIYLTLTWKQANTLFFFLLDHKKNGNSAIDVDLDMIVQKLIKELE